METPMAGEGYLIPIFLINGQLESGKTTFISELIKMGQFDSAKKKLLILCEEGEEEYDEELLKEHGVDLVVLEKEDFTEAKLEELNTKYDPWVVILEYNGMWEPQLVFETSKPEGWEVYQAITIVNAATFPIQWKNMQSIMAETVKSAESVIFNRSNLDMDLGAFQRSMRALNPAIDVVFEDEEGHIMTGIKAILPYDLDSNPVVLEDRDFGIWFMDARDKKEDYEGKTYKFTAQVLKVPELEKNEFVVSRKAMTCCEDDIAIIGYICKYDKASELEDKDWVYIEADMIYDKKSAYNNEEGPVLIVKSIKKVEEPKEEVVSF